LILAHKLRMDGFSVELDLSGSGFKKQFTRADRSGAVACLILGDEEAENQIVKLKWMATKEQIAIAQTDLLAMSDRLRQQINTFRTSP
ncbi:MAG TPA: histidine--tRNA ligase, partial [Cyanobacteria bacterium UBA11049]|nr:histidine--tRNA ligase [Cyanobacteria bacterium UBA11049]